MTASITETRDLIQPQTLYKYNYIWIRPDSEVQNRWSLNKSHYKLCWTKFKVEDVTNTIEVTESVDLLTEESSEGIDGSTQTEQEATTETESTTGGSFVDSIHEYDEISVPQQGSLEEDTNDTNITTESSVEVDVNTDKSNKSEQNITNSDIETTTAEKQTAWRNHGMLPRATRAQPLAPCMRVEP